MTYERGSDEGLSYFPCRYDGSKLLFRGPRKPLTGDYVAFLGGSETYGTFAPRPFPDLLADTLAITTVNLGCINAGVDVFSRDPGVQAICQGAKATVVQVTGAQNLSNRLFTVHPRRNDRFLKASQFLRGIYGDVDFTRFRFTRDLLGELQDVSAEKFDQVLEELKTAWVARTVDLVKSLGPNVVLLWMSDAPPEVSHDLSSGIAPLFVDRAMLDQVRPHVTTLVEVVASDAAHLAGSEGLVFSDMDQIAVSHVPGMAKHQEVAAALAPVLAEVLQ